jgi:Restriction Enzyme Adenine Methylase Associated
MYPFAGVRTGGHIRRRNPDMPFLPIAVTHGSTPVVTSDFGWTELDFKDLGLTEAHIEDFIRDNIGELFKDAEESDALLIVGQQVRNQEQARFDLVAIDSSGNLVIIEVKRDKSDCAARKEPVELQAVRYAASLATLKTPEELVQKLFAPYLKQAGSGGNIRSENGRTAEEEAKRRLSEFLTQNRSERSFNQRQRIILIGSGFESQALASVTWLSQNGVLVSCYELKPALMGECHVMRFEKVAPPPTAEDFYIGFPERQSGNIPAIDGKTSTGGNRRLASISDLLAAGLLRPGEILRIRGREGTEAELQADGSVKFGDQKLSANQWGLKVTKFSAIQIYSYAENQKGELLNDLRQKLVELSGSGSETKDLEPFSPAELGSPIGSMG